MNRKQAEELLSLYRPHSADANDPEFAEALEFAQRDSELGRWFETHCANHEKMRARFAEISVPAGLKEQILAEREIEIKIVSRPSAFWRQWPLAAAAIFILLFALAAFWIPNRTDKNFARFRNRMLSAALRSYSMDLETGDLTRIKTFLAQNHAPSQFALPAGLTKAEKTGCAILRWQNQPVSMVCFRTGKPLAAGRKSDLFLFVMDRSAFSKISSSRQLEQINQLATARWVEGDKFYLLAAQGDEELLRRFL